MRDFGYDYAGDAGYMEALEDIEADRERAAADQACFDFAARHRHLAKLARVMELTITPSQTTEGVSAGPQSRKP